MGEIKFKNAGSLQKGNYLVVEGVACIVSDVAISRPGKHGHAKCNITAVGMLDGKKRAMVVPGSHDVEVPVIEKRNAQVLSVSDDVASVMDSETYENFEMKIPEELKGQINSGDVVVYWVVLDERILKQKKIEGQ